MSGHSEWATTKHQKGRQVTPRRGKMFARLIKEVSRWRVGG